jgi:hypothetical protein
LRSSRAKQLLQIEARHLPPKEQSPLVELAPDSLHGRMTLTENPMFGRFGSFL